MILRFSPLKVWFGFLIIGLWSSALFEKGLAYFQDILGVSIFVLFGAVFLASSSLYFVLGGKLLGRSFFQNHALLSYLYVCYWLISWIGVLYSTDVQSGLLTCLQYTWYTILSLLTIFVLYHFSIKQRERLFLLIGLLSFAILIYFSANTLIRGSVITGVDRFSEHGGFSISAFLDYNVFTFSLILSAALVSLGIGGSASHSSVVKVLAYIALVLLAIFLGVFSGSRRSVVLYGPTAILVPLFLLLRRSWRRFIVISSLASLALAVFAPRLTDRDSVTNAVFANLDDTAFTAANKRITRGLGFLTGDYGDTSARTERWGAALDVASEYSFFEIFLGRGTRGYFAEPEFIRPDGSHDSPHNFLLSALLEGGFFKLFVIGLFVIVWSRHIWLKHRRWSKYRQGGFWFINFLLVANLLWLISVLISGEEFFASKQFLLIFIVYAAFWDSPQVSSAAKDIDSGKVTCAIRKKYYTSS